MAFGDDFWWECEHCGDLIVGRTPQQLRKLWREHREGWHESTDGSER